MKDEFLAMVSHELRTPIQVIRSALELLSSDRPQDRERLVDQATRGLQRLSRTVEDVLDLAQLQETGIELTRELVRPESLLAEAAVAHELMAAEHGHVLRIEDSSDAPAVLVDRRRMSQVLGNLVANALRYSPPRSTVRLAATLHGDEVRLAVSDEGPGIPAAERERIFDKFYRLKATRQIAGGSGLGLAIAKSLVELHGGRIWVEEAPTGGSAFVVAVHAEPAAVPAVPR
jgi:signal transduction histidine kinase